MPVAIVEDVFDYTKQPNSDIVEPVRRFTFSDEAKAIRIQVIVAQSCCFSPPKAAGYTTIRVQQHAPPNAISCVYVCV